MAKQISPATNKKVLRIKHFSRWNPHDIFHISETDNGFKGTFIKREFFTLNDGSLGVVR